MKEWIVLASRAEAKIFERTHKDEELRWIKTLTNKKGRRKERDFESDSPGLSYAKFASSCAPHALEKKHLHAEITARTFVHQIVKFVEKSLDEKRFEKLIIYAGPHFLGLMKEEMAPVEKRVDAEFVPKNIEKANSDSIALHLEHDHL